MPKKRAPIPDEISTEIMFASDSTCCKCNQPGRPVQIHHIDSNPANNEQSNLAVLCVLCHDATLLQGGFGRKLNPQLVARYRDDWVTRVDLRRQQTRGLVELNVRALNRQGVEIRNELLSTDWLLRKGCLAFIKILPNLRRSLLATYQPEWDTGVTSKVVKASLDYINTLETVLVTLAIYYPPHHFNGQEPKVYFSSLIATRFLWHRLHSEPDGIGTGGTMTNIIYRSLVIRDTEGMIEDVVYSLSSLIPLTEEIDLKAWSREWRTSEEP